MLSHGLQRVISTDGTSEKATQDQICSGADLKLVLFCRFENGPLGTGHDDESSLPVSAWVKSAMAQPETRVVMIAAASNVLWGISFVFNEPHVVSASSREGKYVD